MSFWNKKKNQTSDNPNTRTDRQLRRSKDFDAHRKTEEPSHPAPKSTQQTIDILRIYSDGIFEIKPGVFTSSYFFQSGQYSLKDDEERAVIADIDTDLKNGLGADLEYTFINRPMVKESVLDKVILPGEGKEHKDADSEEEKLVKDFNRYICGKVSGSLGGMERITVITMTIRTKNYAEAKQLLDLKEEKLKNKIGQTGSRITRLSTKERLSLFSVFYGSYRAGLKTYEQKEELRDFKNDIAPVYFEQQRDYLRIGEKYVRALFAAQLPTDRIEDSFIHDLQSRNYDMMISAHLTQIPMVAVRNKLDSNTYAVERRSQKEQANNRKEKNYDSRLSRRTRDGLKALEELEESYRTEKMMFFASLNLILKADSLEELNDMTEEMQMVCDEYSVRLEPELERQREGLSTTFPLGVRFTKTMRSMWTTSTFMFHPYWSTELFEEGICYGIDRISHRPIVGDRRKLDNPHALIFGTSGATKSSIAKTEMLQIVKKKLGKIIVFDPTGEYLSASETLGGSFVDMSMSSSVRINPLEIPYGAEFEMGAFVTRKAELMISLLKDILGNDFNAYHGAVMDRAVKALYDTYSGKKAEKKELQPVLSDLTGILEQIAEGKTTALKSLEEKAEPDPGIEERKIAKEILLALAPLTSGTVQTFNGLSTINIWDKPVTVVGMHHVSKQIYNPMLLIFFDYVETIAMRNLANGEATYFYIDELHELLKKPVIAEDLTTRWKIARHDGIVLTGILQDVTDVSEHEAAKHLLTNSDTCIILKQQPKNLSVIIKEIGISQDEASYASGCEQGCGVLKFSKLVLPFDNVVSPEERNGAYWNLINTDRVR